MELPNKLRKATADEAKLAILEALRESKSIDENVLFLKTQAILLKRGLHL